MRRLFVLLGLLGLAMTGWAMTLHYSSGTTGLVVTAANVNTPFRDNHSGGSSATFQARHVLIRPRTGGNTCFVDLGDGVATTADTRLPAGSTFIADWDETTGGVGGGWSAVGAICASAETATWDVDAWR